MISRLSSLSIAAIISVMVAMIVGAQQASAAKYSGMSRQQIALVKQRISAGDLQAQRLLGRIGGYLTISKSNSDLGGGDYTETFVSNRRTRFRVYLSPRALTRFSKSDEQLAYDSHMLWHELGHVITNAYLTAALYDQAFNVFRQSSLWQDCFSDVTSADTEACVPADEILADQIAFFATKNIQARSPRNVPPLFTGNDFAGKVIKPMLRRSPS